MDQYSGVQMTVLRVVRVLAALMLPIVWIGCGETYRPVAFPITPSPPNPGAFHYAFVVNQNGVANPGTGAQIDVSGDSMLSVVKVGLGPVHAAITPDGSQVYVANKLEDTVSEFPASPPSLPVIPTTITLPAGSQPVFVHTRQTGAVYVANFGTSTVAEIPTGSNVVSNLISLGAGAQPVALAETPDAKKLYSANQGNGTVTSINTVDFSVNAVIPLGTSPVWAVTRSDSARVYALDSATGIVYAIDTALDVVVSNTVSAGAGANFMLYDPTRNRLYITNPTANTVTVLDASTDALTVLGTLSVPNPVSIAALPDGSRAYAASASMSGTNLSSQVTVIDASNVSLTGKVIPLSTVPSVCDPNTRFRIFVAAAAGSSKVYVSNCDAGGTAIINTSATATLPADSLVLNLPAPAGNPQPTSSNPNPQPAPQNPVFVLTGQ
ncbi:MAG: hypothetical protein NVS1B11_26860 [Terriglobales bacterium]